MNYPTATMPTPFVIFSLPRSRSAWLSKYLSYPPHRVGHDIAVTCACAEDFLDYFRRGMIGTIETGAQAGWRCVKRRMPDARLIVVRRNLEDVYASFRELGIEVPRGEFEPKADALDALSREVGVTTIPFSALSREDTCEALFELCLGIPWDREWYESLATQNIQVNVRQRLQYIWDNRERIEAFKASIAAEIASYG